jgi:hypothetical protein
MLKYKNICNIKMNDTYKHFAWVWCERYNRNVNDWETLSFLMPSSGEAE